MRIVLTGGGTGGHLFPLVSIAQELKREIGDDLKLLYIGSGKQIEKGTMEKEGVKVKNVLSGKRRRYFSFLNFVDVFKIPVGVVQALWILLIFMPDAVFSKGGYASVPVVLVSWLYRIPVLIHESDAIPGTANMVLAKFSRLVAVSYPSAEKYFPKNQVVLTGNPVRVEINQGSAWDAYGRYHFTESKPVILILGGSQGSQIINKAIIRILPRLLEYFQVVHQTGEKNFDDVKKMAGEQGIKVGHEGYQPVKFLETSELKDAFSAASLVVSRAGANTISEIAANSKAAILVPLRSAAKDHQRMNAYELAKIGAAVVLEEDNLGEHLLFDKINMLLTDDELRTTMEQKIKAFYHPDAARRIVEGIKSLL
jgi:UDP-N-acetylglucosamine--N-acetylmuramyl-(pentapeptide) pyrophosphoryl-undecaprenol N-acetylglucosamine transferase